MLKHPYDRLAKNHTITVCGKTAEMEEFMKVIMKVGPRNEEMIAQVKNILDGTFGCAGFGDEENTTLYRQIALEKLAEKCESKNELLDAIYYACGERKEGLEDREAYFQEQMNGDEFSYFAEALAGKEFQWN